MAGPFKEAVGQRRRKEGGGAFFLQSGAGLVAQNDLAWPAARCLTADSRGDFLYFATGFEKGFHLLCQVDAMIRYGIFLGFACHNAAFPDLSCKKWAIIHNYDPAENDRAGVSVCSAFGAGINPRCDDACG